MLSAAYESGIRYYDAAPAYADSERYQGLFWRQNPSAAAATFQASKSAERDADGARADLARTLTRLGRDDLGLWQIHDIRTRSDLRQLEGRGGALSAFLEARESGTVRGIGVTGHNDPEVLKEAVARWDIDTVLLPVNPVEAAIGGFLDRVTMAARERGIGVIGMKVLGAGNYIFPDAGITADLLIRFALAQPVDMIVTGCSSAAEAQALAAAARAPGPLEAGEQDALVEKMRPYAKRVAYYRGVIK
jgi:aryl-alcohol dehydrogenase-like predicted oxidoreductase